MGAAKKQYIQDPLYGMVHLSELEMRIIDSQAFQRLLNVKQLGYAYAVFPGADYSRFAHSVGACYVMGRWIETLERNHTPLSPAHTELYRLAALMHDIGHYPFSHATEHAAEDYYSELLSEENNAPAQLLGEQPQGQATPSGPNFLKHERLGAYLVQNDTELKSIITEAGLSTEALTRVFQRHEVAHWANLLSSDVDADRLDFLRRSAHHTGLTYGHIDQQYLVTELRIDRDDRLCWTEKALSALDHLLIARYFDYQQVVYNKTVVALEQVLRRLVQAMLRSNHLDLSLTEVKRRLKETNDWIECDDHLLFEKIRTFQQSDKSTDPEKELCKSILRRNPPRRVAGLTFIDWYDLEEKFDLLVRKVRLCVPNWSRRFEIPEDLWFVWKSVFRFTDYKYGFDFDEGENPEELAKVPRILKGSAGNSIPIIQEPQSLFYTSFARRRYDLRVYVVLPELADPRKKKEASRLRDEISAIVSQMVAEIDMETIGPRPASRKLENIPTDAGGQVQALPL